MSTENYLELDFRGIADSLVSDRREFLKVMGGGIFIFLALGETDLFAQRRGGRPSMPTDFNAFLKIGDDGRVSCFTGKIEMGQGIVTSLAQMLAGELNVPIEQVDVVMGDTDLCPWDMGTFGSMTTRFFGPPLRAAAVEAKAVLLQMAAERLEVPVERLTVEGGVVAAKDQQDERVSYADLAQGKTIQRHLKQAGSPKAMADFSVVGKPVLRRDSRDKVTGRAIYAADVRLPGMLCAKILRPPVHGAKLKSVDTSEAAKIAGVRVVKEGDLVAVLHEHPDVAENALKKVKAEFDLPQADVDDKTIFDHLLKVAPEGRSVGKGGDLKAGEQLASQVVEATYLNSYVAHSPIEPHAAAAKIEDGKLTVWASTQNPFTLRDELARTLGFSPANVRVIPPFLGGGFGGKTANQQAIEAARLAKSVGKPVQVAWSRAEEFFFDTFRPAAIVKIKSGVDDAGRIVLWDYHVYFAGEREAQHFYDIPHHSTMSHGGGCRAEPGTHPFATGAWRGPGSNTNSHARESHIDLMAAKAGTDPVEFRLKNLKDPRMVRVLKAAAEKFGWTPQKTPSGRGFGVACGIDSGTYVALMAEVKVDKELGNVHVKRVRLRPGHGTAHQSRRGENPDGGLRHHGIGLHAGRRDPLQGRRYP